ncbi:MAG: hypothetical protein EKK40_16960 [Bradyrhizobiaceae bacterium]|nr:MAG: hypothetical protein EKK40_16960 [Bradyrhizobiaceae bacterium]
MALAANELAEIGRMLAAPDAPPQAHLELRRRFPHLSWVSCDASDVTETPYRSFGAFDLHLLDSADHCVQITDDSARASGILLAKRAVGS